MRQLDEHDITGHHLARAIVLLVNKNLIDANAHGELVRLRATMQTNDQLASVDAY